MKLYITETQYEKHEKKLEAYSKEHHKCNYYPTDEDLEKIKADFPKYFLHMLWIADYCIPETEEEKIFTKKIRDLCYECIEFVTPKELKALNKLNEPVFEETEDDIMIEE